MRLPAVSGPAQPAKERLQTHAPALQSWHPDPPLVCRQGPLPPRASYLRSHMAAGSAQTGWVATPAEKRRRGEVRASSRRLLPAPRQVIWLTGRERLSVGLGAQLQPMLSRSGRPSSSGAPRARRLGSGPIKSGPQFHSFFFFL